MDRIDRQTEIDEIISALVASGASEYEIQRIAPRRRWVGATGREIVIDRETGRVAAF